MPHLPIILKDIALFFNEKVLFEGFSARIFAGDRIAITGNNGSGKSTLLKVINSSYQDFLGQLETPSGLVVAYVGQTIDDFLAMSGGERFNRALSQALALKPDILCLDEPTNHLDRERRRSLLAFLRHYSGTLIVASHDRELLALFNKLWHLEESYVYQYSGSYDEFIQIYRRDLDGRDKEKARLRREKALIHRDLMREQERAKKKRLHGEKKYDGDKLALRSAQGRGQLTSNRHKKRIGEEKNEVLKNLRELRMPEVIKFSFSLPEAAHFTTMVLSISDGSCGYSEALLKNINLYLAYGERLAIVGPNGAGKSTLIKAVLNDACIVRGGTWRAPALKDIGYLDQHYKTLPEDLCAMEIIKDARPNFSPEQCRLHLNTFLFRSNQEVMTKVKYLSGGEKARLSLSQIAAQAPKLLILDELTNNLDMRTRTHVIEVLSAYPGTLIIISHDEEFLTAIGVSKYLEL